MHIVHRVASTAALAGVALGFAGCSDSTITTPSELRAPSGVPARAVVDVGLTSGSGTQFCGSNAGLGVIFAPGACVAAPDVSLTAQGLTFYNPGWDTPLGADWVGPQNDSPQYNTPPGTYVFRTTFNIPAGATAPSLNLGTLGDNAVTVLLNGHTIGTQTIADCNGGPPCNWNVGATNNITDNTASDFVIGGTNVLLFYLTNTPIGFPANNCANGPQAGAPQQLPSKGGTWDVTTCFNPTGLLYSGAAHYTPFVPPPAIPLFVIGDLQSHDIGDNVMFWGAQWWKNNPVSGVFDNGWESFKGFADIVNGSCGSTWASLPGNSSKPPKSIGSDIAIIVTSTVTKDGNNEGGNIVEILIVHTDPGYAGNPGHAGTGTVTSVVCSTPPV